MPVFTYKALNQHGKTVKGVVDADTPKQARLRLRQEGLFPIEINADDKARQSSEIFSRLKNIRFTGRSGKLQLTEATRQMATLLSAGLPLVSVLEAVQEQAEDQNFGRMFALIRDEVTQGESFASTLEKHKDVFPLEYIHLVRAGEIAGSLDNVLERLADNLEKKQNRRAKITAALAYPAFMTIVGAGVLFFLLSFIVPTLTDLFEDLDAALPWPTRLLLLISGFLESYWWLALVIIALLIYAAVQLLKKEKYYRKVEKFVFYIPVFGPLLKKLRLSQAIRGLAVMTSGGAPLTTALTVTARGLGHSVFASALEKAAQSVGQGRSLEASLGQSGLFPPVALRMVAVGETGGVLTAMLERAAASYEDETDRVLSTLTSLVEPVIILMMGLLVGFVVLAVLLPIFDLSGLVG